MFFSRKPGSNPVLLFCLARLYFPSGSQNHLTSEEVFPAPLPAPRIFWICSKDGHNRRRGKHRRLCSISIEKLNIFLAKFSTEVNVDKKKDRPLFQRTVESGCIQFCRELLLDFSAVCSPYCLRCSISVRLSPSCRMLSGRWKSWVSGSNPSGMQSGFSPCTAHFTIRRECPATASVHPFPRLGGRLSAGTGKFFKEPRSLLPVAAWLRIFLTKR